MDSVNEEVADMVKCEFHGDTFYITNEVLSEVLLRMQLKGRHLYRYERYTRGRGVGQPAFAVCGPVGLGSCDYEGAAYHCPTEECGGAHLCCHPQDGIPDLRDLSAD